MDCRDVPVSTGNQDSLARRETALTLLNGYFLDPLEEIETALAEDPEFIMGHCLRGGMMAVAAEKAAEPFLRESVEVAEALADKANDRERGHIAAMRAWLDRDFAVAVIMLTASVLAFVCAAFLTRVGADRS
ncbi:MAG: hypothetical protein ACPGQM_07045 [Alphaproteobacteria bacterium]